MGLADRLGMAGQPFSIDWELTPSDTFGMFESWGGKERIRNNAEKHYYFYIDNWGEQARLFLMERGVKHARILARIACPQELLERCVARQGKGLLDKSYAIDDKVKAWLLAHIFEAEEFGKVEPLDDGPAREDLETGLPLAGVALPKVERVSLRAEGRVVAEQEVAALVGRGGFHDSRRHPNGRFDNLLVDNGDGLTVTDQRTGLMWQRGGCDITNIRNVKRYVEELNRKRFAGHDDWRLPTMEEALSLMEPRANDKGIHLHPCFSREQPFIFLADQRKPGGYWFADFKQATVFWASGSIPGGFGRVCRSL
ncbi:MAG: DUF1566 domain-containing protein [Thermodesulfobacteriota bacterium]